jgi:hypothetical protein
VNAPYTAPLLQRTLAATYQFYDAFLFPVGERTPPVTAPLEVSIPSFKWSAFRGDDFTYRFSALTLRQAAPSGAGLAVEVVAPGGDYVNFEPILLSLPLPLSSPPKRSDFLIVRPLWPTTALRPPGGETVVRGFVRSPTAQPIADLKVEMWLGAGATPPPGTPYTRSNVNGDFLFRFPLLKRPPPGTTTAIKIQLAGGTIPISPASTSIAFGETQIIRFQRT